jgi:hypothetical protein
VLGGWDRNPFLEEFCFSNLATTIEEEQYYCKALTNGTIKINITTTD